MEDSEIHIIAGDFNGHEGKAYGTRNPEGLRILDLCSDLAISNTFFDKNQNKLITFSSADNNSQIDYILVKKPFLKHVCDIKVTRNEECITQHKLLATDITVAGRSPKPCIGTPRRKVWKIGDPTVRKDYKTFVNEKCTGFFSSDKPVGVNDAWNKVKACL